MAIGPLKLSTLLVGEGPEECAFVRQMIAEQIVPPMEIAAISDLGTGGGFTGLQKFLEALSGVTDFSTIQRIGIVADNDADHQAMFDYIKAAISAANANADLNGRLSVPDAAYVTATNSAIATKVILLPDAANTGCLETLLLRVLDKHHQDIMNCVHGLVNCAGINAPPGEWSRSKIDKAKVRAAIAMLYKRNPAQSLAFIWKNKPDLIPVADPEFNGLVGHLNAI